MAKHGPDFIIIGAQKCGTVSLGTWLTEHPDVTMVGNPEQKTREFHFFSKAQHWKRGIDWYRSQFPIEGVSGERTPRYIVDFKSHERIGRFLPEVKLILLLRNPIDRAYSAHNNYMQALPKSRPRDWLVPGGSFAENLDAEEETDFSKGFVHRGIYINQIEHFLTHVPRNRLQITIFERLITNPRVEYARICHFIGVGESRLQAFTPHNQRRYPRSLDPTQHQRLQSIFAPYNERLFTFLGDDVPEWRFSAPVQRLA